MCPWDNFKQHCSNNGQCIYDPSIQATPFCKCNAYFTLDKDPIAAKDALDECNEQGLQIQSNGWCAYFDADRGFDDCYLAGQCGVCEDKAGARRKHSISLSLILSVLSVFVTCMR